MAPKRAVAYILSFELPDDEAACIIECDVRRKSCVQVAFERNLSVDAVKNTAAARIINLHLNYMKKETAFPFGKGRFFFVKRQARIDL